MMIPLLWACGADPFRAGCLDAQQRAAIEGCQDGERGELVIDGAPPADADPDYVDGWGTCYPDAWFVAVIECSAG